MQEVKQYCSFHVGDHYFGVDVTQVQEVVRYQQMTSVPLSLPEVGGLINLRGQIVTAIDVRRRLQMPARPADQLPMNVVIHTGEQPISLLVDEIGDVVDAGSETFESVPETLVGIAREMVSGVYKLKDRLMLILDVGKTIQLG
jgi:purine-binding chemotaxis protein CheW